MNQHIKSILLLASVLALLVSVRNAQLHAVAPAGTSGAGLSPGAQIEPSPTPWPTPEGDADDAGQATTVESSQAEQAAPSPAEPVGDVDPQSIPSLEERNAILDGVNLGPPILSGDDGQVGVGPAPGTESIMGPMNGSSSLDPEHILSDEERGGILDRVNRGAPLLPEGDREAGVGPAPGTESDTGHGHGEEDAGKAPQPGAESDTERRSSSVGFLIQLIEALVNWWHELLA